MKKKLFILCLLITTFSCKQNNNNEAPKAIEEIIKVDVPSSTFNLPVTYPIKNLQTFINKLIKGNFLQIGLYPLKNKKDSVFISITKKDAIKMRIVKKEIDCFIPLHVKAVLVKSRLGAGLTKKVEPVETEINLKLKTPASLDNQWNIVTKFRIDRYEWVKDPVIKAGFIKYNLKDKLSEVLNKQGKELTKILDNEIYKASPIRPEVERVWDDMQKPIVINKKPAAWIKFLCSDISGKLILDEKGVTSYNTIKAKMTIITDTNNEIKRQPLPPFKKLKKEKEASDIYLYAYTYFSQINEQLNALLKGKSFSAGGFTVALKEIKAYASTSGLSVQVTIDKDVEGSLVASGKLLFDVPTQSMHLKDFDFSVNTNRSLVNASESLLHDHIRDTIAAKLTLNLDTLIDKVPSIVEKAIQKGNSGKIIDLNVDNLKIKQCDIDMGKEKIIFKINVGVVANIRLKDFKVKKALKVNAKV